jgi:dipeptidyl aminopeptidase/acylaminoacyl peptidase
MNEPAVRRRYWRNLGLTIVGAVFIGALLVGVFVVLTVANLASSTLAPARAAIEQTPGDFGIADYHEITFSTLDDISIDGWYIPGDNGAAVILAHGYAGNRTDLLPEAALLAAHGYSVLLFDFRGHGTSGDAPVTFGDHERQDLTAAIDFVAAQPGVDPDRIGALGFSMGGATLALTAAEDSRLRAVVIEAAFASLRDVIDDNAALLGPLSQWPARWAIEHEGVAIDAVDPARALCNISPRPVLLIYGDSDQTIPPGTRQRMFDAACEPVETWVLAGADHENFMQSAPDDCAALLLAFFDRHLPPQ